LPPAINNGLAFACAMGGQITRKNFMMMAVVHGIEDLLARRAGRHWLRDHPPPHARMLI